MEEQSGWSNLFSAGGGEWKEENYYHYTTRMNIIMNNNSKQQKKDRYLINPKYDYDDDDDDNSNDVTIQVVRKTNRRFQRYQRCSMVLDTSYGSKLLPTPSLSPPPSATLLM